MSLFEIMPQSNEYFASNVFVYSKYFHVEYYKFNHYYMKCNQLNELPFRSACGFD